MKKFIAAALTAIATVVGTIATSACVIVLLDEPEMPESLN